MKPLFSLLLLTCILGASITQAADVEARWYRYYDDKKQPNVTDSVTSDHIAHGYDELTAGMQVIKHVPAQRTLTAEEVAAAKAKREADAQRERDDKQLLRLYSSVADAEHARNRQLDAVQLRVDFSTNSLTSLRQRRAAEAQKAAVFERTGKPVPKDTKDGIANYDKQIQSAQTEISARKAEQDKIRSDFAPAIKRLQELTATRTGSSPAITKP
ncbi:MAG: hypothetical protein PSX71_05975 [bacterium]|nr:hypothetical protein [bacterium]